jgi:hypothetical protein
MLGDPDVRDRDNDMSAPIEVVGFEATSGLIVVLASCGGVLQGSDLHQPLSNPGITGLGIGLISTGAGQAAIPDSFAVASRAAFED